MSSPYSSGGSPVAARRATAPNPTVATSSQMEADGARNLVVAGALLGVGAALIDSYYQIPDHGQVYYYGWVLLALAFVLALSTFAEYILDPKWAYGTLFALGVYGWWNIAWTALMVWAGNSIDSAHGKVILANFGVLWPFDHGLVEVSLSFFQASTVAAVAIPLVAYAALRYR